MRDAERSLRRSRSRRQFADAQRSDAALQPSACPGRMSCESCQQMLTPIPARVP